MFPENLLSHLGTGLESEEEPQQKGLPQNWAGESGKGLTEWRERRRSAVSLPDLLPWPEQPVTSQRMPTEAGEKIEQGVAGRKFAGEDLCDPLEKRASGGGGVEGWHRSSTVEME